MEEISPDKVFDEFKPENVIFVLSVDKNGKPNGMVAGWSMKCSFKPRLFAVSLWEKGYTHKLIHQSKEFVVAVPNKKLERFIEVFGNLHGDKVDKFKRTGITTVPAKHLKTPLLPDATINMECKLVKELKAGDHYIFVGEVIAAHIKKGKILLNMGKVENKRVFKEY